MKVANNGLTIVVGGALGHFPEKFVLSALEKQIPEKVIKEVTYDEDVSCSCPTCKNHIGFIWNYHHSYCNKCGQALDWGGTE